VPDKFFQFQNEDIENRLQRVQKITGVDLKHQLLSGEMMTIEK
jgi:hypothetical protein